MKELMLNTINLKQKKEYQFIFKMEKEYYFKFMICPFVLRKLELFTYKVHLAKHICYSLGARLESVFRNVFSAFTYYEDLVLKVFEANQEDFKTLFDQVANGQLLLQDYYMRMVKLIDSVAIQIKEIDKTYDKITSKFMDTKLKNLPELTK